MGCLLAGALYEKWETFQVEYSATHLLLKPNDQGLKDASRRVAIGEWVRLSTLYLSLTEFRVLRREIPFRKSSLWKHQEFGANSSLSEQFSASFSKNSQAVTWKLRLESVRFCTSTGMGKCWQCWECLSRAQHEAYFPCSIFLSSSSLWEKKCFMESRLIRQMSVVN